jgi:hypothetical protein
VDRPNRLGHRHPARHHVAYLRNANRRPSAEPRMHDDRDRPGCAGNRPKPGGLCSCQPRTASRSHQAGGGRRHVRCPEDPAAGSALRDGRTHPAASEPRSPRARHGPRRGTARRIGPRKTGLYLIPAPTGVCLVHGRAGRCSNDVDVLANRGVYIRTTRTHRAVATTNLYGAGPNSFVSVTAVGSGDVVGARVHDNGFAVHVPGFLSNLILSSTRDVVQIPCRKTYRRTRCLHTWTMSH